MSSADISAGGRLRSGRTSYAVASLVAAAGCLIYAIRVPQAPDLAAQLARASVAHASGVTDWWLGWFGGLQLPTYSVLAPGVIAALGVPIAATIAVMVAVLAFTDLVQGTRRAIASSAAFALLAVLDIVAGRLTFALSFACALVVLVAVKRRSWSALPIAVLCCLLGLLAPFFLGIALIAVAVCDRPRRVLATATAGVIVASAVTEQLLFRQTGTMTFGTIDLLGASVTMLGVAVFASHRAVRIGAIIMTIAPLATMLVPGALGENVVRLTWLAAPVLIAESKLHGRMLAFAVVAVLGWPVTDVALQVVDAHDPSAHAVFYQPLITELRQQQHGAGAMAVGERLEVVPTRTHWETRYLTDSVALARGWDRQADVRDDPLFYGGPLDATSYHQWLQQMAVGWVARPRTPLDSAGRGEARLVDGGLPYLRLVWQSDQWDLYRVRDAAPLAAGASVVDVTATSISLHFPAAGVAHLRVRWTPYLRAKAVSGVPGETGCVFADSGFTDVQVTSPGDYVVSTRFGLNRPSCATTDAGRNHRSA